ncbi:LuxR C-terminal-related transcriptional regulator [Actinokineospora sp. 24-640]
MPTLHGRADVLDRLAALVEGPGGALMLTGPPGIGRTALLDAVARLARVPVLRVAGVEPEQDIDGGGLDRLGQRDLAEAAVCLVDDADLLDAPSVAVLAHHARRCAGRGGAVVLAGRAPLPGIDTVVLPALDDFAADRLLAEATALPAEVRAGLVEIARGVPGHLLDLAHCLDPHHQADRPLPAVLPPGGAARTALARAYSRLCPDARLAALRAACGGRVEVVAEALRAGLVAADGGAPSPAVAATVRAEAGPDACRAAWAALAESDPDPARALCHRAAAAPGSVTGTALAAAARTAEPVTAARALRRAAALTADPRVRARRLIDAAAAAWAAGKPARARADLAAAWTDPADLAGEIALLRGEIELRDGDPAIAAHELAGAAGLLDDARRRAVALMLAGEARRMAGDTTGHAAAARDLAALGSAEPLAAAHGAGLAATFAGRHTAALAPLRHAAGLGPHLRDPRRLVWAGEVALTLGQVDQAYEYATAAVGLARFDAPALLPTALAHLAVVALAADRVAAAITAATEGRAASAGQRNVAVEHSVLLALAAVSLGERDTALARLAEAAPRIAERGLGRPAAYAAWTRACVDLLDDRPEDALSRLRTMATGVGRAHPGIRALAVPQLVEAAVRCGAPEVAAGALARFDAWAESLRGPSWRALSHRCHALISTDAATAAEHYDRAIALHRRAGATLELARTHLIYAHHLRRERQPNAARTHLREAQHLFHTHGARYWEERVRVELRAATPSPAVGGLTPQQTQIARLVADGETNREIAQRLVLSPRTVDHHLRNIYTRLGIRSRTELATLVTRGR